MRWSRALCPALLAVGAALLTAQAAHAQTSDAPIGRGPNDPLAFIEYLYLTPANVSFEIDYPGSSRNGSWQVMQAIAVFAIPQADGTFVEEEWNVSGYCNWNFSNPNVYKVVTGNYANLDYDGLTVAWPWGPSAGGTTSVGVSYMGTAFMGRITATDSRK